MEHQMYASPLHKDPRLPELYTQYARKLEAQQRIRELKRKIQSTHDVLQMEELKARKRVLRRLGFINDADANSGGDDDDDDDDKPKTDKKAGRRKIKIEFIQDKSRRHITFSKRKAGACPPVAARPAARDPTRLAHAVTTASQVS